LRFFCATLIGGGFNPAIGSACDGFHLEAVARQISPRFPGAGAGTGISSWWIWSIRITLPPRFPWESPTKAVVICFSAFKLPMVFSCQRRMRMPSKIVWIVIVSCWLTGLTGCVSRRMTVRTVPAGALVEMDGKRLGTSPVSTDFTYYGTHEFTISAPGYETLTVQQKVKAPFHQHVPIDFISNHFMPGRVTDRHDFTYVLQPSTTAIDEEQNLINRGRNFRSQSEVGR